MKHVLKVLFLFALLAILHHDEALAQRRGGGGRGGGMRGGAMRGGGGGFRGGGMRSRGGARTSMSSRPRASQRPAARATRPMNNRPTARTADRARPATRPGAGGAGVQRPAARPGAGTGIANRPGTRPGQAGGGIRNNNVRGDNVRRGNNVIDNDHINIDNEIDIDGDWGDWGDGCCWVDHPIGAGIVAGATAAAIADDIYDYDDYPYPYYPMGTTVYTIPSDCVTVVENGIAYKQCGDQWYEPSFSGTEVNYTVVTAP